MSTSTEFFRTEMLWTLGSAPYSEIIKIPRERERLSPDEQQDRRDAFNRIINDITDKMVPEFRDENRKNYSFLRRVNVVTILKLVGSSPFTIHGPNGPNVSKTLPRVN